MKNSLLGKPIEGYEGKYWHVQEDDKHPTGFMMSGAGVKIPRCMHIPTGSKWSYIKVYLTLVDGRKIAAWKKHEEVPYLGIKMPTKERKE